MKTLFAILSMTVAFNVMAADAKKEEKKAEPAKAEAKKEAAKK